MWVRFAAQLRNNRSVTLVYLVRVARYQVTFTNYVLSFCEFVGGGDLTARLVLLSVPCDASAISSPRRRYYVLDLYQVLLCTAVVQLSEYEVQLYGPGAYNRALRASYMNLQTAASTV